MTCYLSNPKTKQGKNLSTQLDNLLTNLQNISPQLSLLVGLTNEELDSLDLLDPVISINQSIHYLKTIGEQRQISNTQNNISNCGIKKSNKTGALPNRQWTNLRQEAKRANQLTNQLNMSIRKIHAEMEQLNGKVPDDIVQLNQTVNNSIMNMVSDWSLDLA
ncbi:MAG: hypothetical protein CL609_24055 [Anaerolineaceae bacterium]|nr:hypothetical protein [Anaerolineaceae bacterium]